MTTDIDSIPVTNLSNSQLRDKIRVLKRVRNTNGVLSDLNTSILRTMSRELRRRQREARIEKRQALFQKEHQQNVNDLRAKRAPRPEQPAQPMKPRVMPTPLVIPDYLNLVLNDRRSASVTPHRGQDIKLVVGGRS